MTYFHGTFTLVCIDVISLPSPTSFFSSSLSVMFSRVGIPMSPPTAVPKCVPTLKQQWQEKLLNYTEVQSSEIFYDKTIVT